MELLVIVEPREAFDRWLAEQAAPAAAQPGTEEERRGQQVFSQGPCVLCHVICGTGATGYSATAPDLTHLKSRRTIAAGTLPNTKGYLGGWILDPQTHKPGTQMPVNLLPSDDFQALLAYLETLQ
jgi:cytochrome c oxidase subunit II